MAKRKKSGNKSGDASLFDAAGDGDTPSGPTDEARPAARSGADPVSQLRALRHHVARAARRPRRAEAGPAPHPLHDVAAEPDRRRQAPQVREGRRRRDGELPPARRPAIYETLVRMAQSFSLRYPLVDGSGNFGSLDGDSAAAMRYTECRLARLSDELLTEIDQSTVPFRPNYDGTKTEPVVLPSRIPNLLINGATGIAVGMATNIPPHNLTEVCTALIKLLDNPDLTQRAVVPLRQGTGLSDRRRDAQLARRAEGDLQDRLRRDPPARDVGDGPGDARLEDDLHHQRPLHGQQVDAGRADRRRRAQPQAAAAARRPRPVDRRRADRDRAEEGRRREDGHGVPLQAHAAADQLPGQPDVPGADRGQSRSRAVPSAWICTRCSSTSCTSGSTSSPSAWSTSSRR